MATVRFIELISWAAFAAVAYAFIANRLLAFGGAFRTIVIELGAHLLEDQNVPEERKDIVKRSLNLAMSRQAAWFAALHVIPMTIAIRQKLSKEERERRRAFPDGMDHKPRYWDAWTAYGQALILAVLSNSPMALFLYYAQMAFVSWVVWPHMVMMRVISEAMERHLDEQMVSHKASPQET